MKGPVEEIERLEDRALDAAILTRPEYRDPEIVERLRDAGCDVPLIGDFHYNGHLLLTRYPACAEALDALAAALAVKP